MAGRATRARNATRPTTCRTSRAARTCTRRVPARSSRRTSRTAPGRTVVPGEKCITASSAISGVALLHRRPVPGGVPGRVVLRRLRAPVHLVRAQGRERAAGHVAAEDVRLQRRRARVAHRRAGRHALVHRRLRRQRAPDRGLQPEPRSRGSSLHLRAAEPPLTVQFDGTGSFDPEDEAITYAWDLDGDGEFDDSTAAKPSWEYTRRGLVNVRLKVTDVGGRTGIVSETVTVGKLPELRDRRLPVAVAGRGPARVLRGRARQHRHARCPLRRSRGR